MEFKIGDDVVYMGYSKKFTGIVVGISHSTEKSRCLCEVEWYDTPKFDIIGKVNKPPRWILKKEIQHCKRKLRNDKLKTLGI